MRSITDIHESLLGEVDGHQYEDRALTGEKQCYHDAHRTLTKSCWRAEVGEYLKTQQCPSKVVIDVDFENIEVTCNLPIHDARNVWHEGWLPDPACATKGRLVRWDTDHLQHLSIGEYSGG